MKAPREVPCWDQYFLNLARAASARSKDPDTQVGCVIADPRRRVVSTGYNGPPPGINDRGVDWSRPAKYDVVIHAETNAVLHAQRNLAGCTLYVTGRPCSVCMRLVAASGVGQVVFSPLPIAMVNEEEWQKTMRVANLCGVVLREVELGGEWEVHCQALRYAAAVAADVRTLLLQVRPLLPAATPDLLLAAYDETDDALGRLIRRCGKVVSGG